MQPFRDSSIRGKLSMLIFCTSLLGLSIAGMAFEIYERASFRAALINELTAHADMLGSNTAASLAFNDRKSAQDLMSGSAWNAISWPHAFMTFTETSLRNTGARAPAET
jgi:hypothetical protein